MPQLELAGRTALVTGGAKGIGRACCELLAQAGADVAVNYLTSQTAAQGTADLIRAAGRRACVVRADVSSTGEVDAMVAEVTAALGPIDLLVNNAGIFHYGSHAETTPEIWQRTLDVNATGTYLVTWAVKDSMIDRGFGRIVNVSSISGLRARPMSIAYSASKGAVIAFTRSVAEAWAANNIRVNAVAPGLVETDIIDGVEPQRLAEIVDSTPMRRIGQPREIAELVLFLLSERSSFTTGQTLVASGGRVMLP